MLQNEFASGKDEAKMSVVATGYTLAFVQKHLPTPCTRILEIGSGEGALARALVALGYELVAIEANAETADATRKLGVITHNAQWPDFEVEAESFDAVLFTRSLHHIRPVHEALRHARTALRSGGRVLIEDFAYDAAGARELAWFAGMMRLLLATGTMANDESWMPALARSAEPLSVWRAEHDHDLQTSATMFRFADQVFGNVKPASAAYFFRYLQEALLRSEERPDLVAAFLQMEEAMIAANVIAPLGRRMVAEKIERSVFTKSRSEYDSPSFEPTFGFGI